MKTSVGAPEGKLARGAEMQESRSEGAPIAAGERAVDGRPPSGAPQPSRIWGTFS